MRARGGWVSAACGLLVLSGCAGMQTHGLGETNQALIERAAMLERDRNAQVQANLHAVQMALEMYAVDHAGRYPGQTSWFQDLKGPYYLEGDHVPASPWSDGGVYQTNIIDSGPLAKRAIAATSGTALGPGQVPDGQTFGLTTYGAIVYQLDAERNVYHLYAIGRDGNQAVVKGHVSNE